MQVQVEVVSEHECSCVLACVCVFDTSKAIPYLPADRPDPPMDLDLSDPAARSVRLTWIPGSDHRSPITGEYARMNLYSFNFLGHYGRIAWFSQKHWRHFVIRQELLKVIVHWDEKLFWKDAIVKICTFSPPRIIIRLLIRRRGGGETCSWNTQIYNYTAGFTLFCFFSHYSFVSPQSSWSSLKRTAGSRGGGRTCLLILETSTLSSCSLPPLSTTSSGSSPSTQSVRVIPVAPHPDTRQVELVRSTTCTHLTVDLFQFANYMFLRQQSSLLDCWCWFYSKKCLAYLAQLLCWNKPQMPSPEVCEVGGPERTTWKSPGR